MTDPQRNVLKELRAAGVILSIDGEYLHYRAPAGAFRPELRAALQAMKVDLLYEYHERAAILEYDGGQPHAEAEACAAEIVLGGAQ